MMESIYNEYNIIDKICYTTTDNGSNFVKAFNVYGIKDESDAENCDLNSSISNNENADDQISESDDELDTTTEYISIQDVIDDHDADTFGNDENITVDYHLPKHGRCAAHTLNLIATQDCKGAFHDKIFKKQMRLTFGKCTGLWNKQNRSSVAADLIHHKLGKYLKTPNDTRWNSTYDSLLCIANIFTDRDASINFGIICDELKISRFNKNDTDFLLEYLDIMKPIAIALDLLQGEKQMYMGMLLPTLKEIKNQFAILNKNPIVYCKSLLESMSAGLNRRFENQFNNKSLLLASISHPCFKLDWLDTEKEKDSAKSLLKQSIQMIIESNDEIVEQNNNKVDKGCENTPKQSFFSWAQKRESNISKEKLIDNEIFLHFSTPIISLEDTNGKDTANYVNHLRRTPNIEAIFLEYNTPLPTSDDDHEYKPSLSESSSDTEIEEISGKKKKKLLKKSEVDSSSSSFPPSSTSGSNSSSTRSNTSSSSDSESDKETASPPSVIPQSLPPLNTQSQESQLSPANCSQNEFVEVYVPIDLSADLAMTSKEDEVLQKSQNSPVLSDKEAEVENTTVPIENNNPLPLKELAHRFVNSLLAPNTDPIATTSRKKRRQGSKKETAKILRNLGLPYTSASTGRKHVGSRQLKEPCNVRCRLKCSERLSQDTRQQIFEQYWKMASLSRQRDFIAKSMTEVKPKYQYKRLHNNRLPRHAFYFTVNGEKQRVCKFFFKNTLDINDRPIRTVISKLNTSGIVEPEKRGKHEKHATKIPEVLLEGVRKHINKIPRIESHYLRKQTTREYIDGGKSLTDLYADYKKECLKNNDEYVKIHTFRKVFNTEFNISFFIPKKDQCDLCTSYKNANQEEKSSLEEKYQNHLEEKERSRIEKTKDKEQISPSKIVACYDLQAVLPVPRGDVSVFYYKSKLNCFNFTICELGTDNTECFFWNEVEGQRGACEIGTCVYKYLQKKSAATSEPLELVFYSDNCCGQQKNQFIISLYIYAVEEMPNVKSITHKFLIKGHTQNEGDAAYSTIERQIKKALRSGPIYVPDQYVQLIRDAKKKGNKFIINEMSHSEFYNIKNLADQKLNKNTDGETVKIGDIKIIRIEKTNDDDTNRVTVFYKTSYFQDFFKEINLSKPQSRSVRMQNIRRRPQLKRLYNTKLQLTERKKADLRALIQSNHIPRYYASSFYDNIINH
ncbi:hypothetical protein evm_011986 [Chilo suppressalis]|nr:hypothetical protein evm_011986 [Chilo suppressalis]